MLQQYFADMHIHIGRDMFNQPVKITASPALTLTNILMEASRRKGIHMVGVIDSQAPAVQQEINQLIKQGKAYELDGGGIRFEQVTLILGSEIEIYDSNCKGPIHALCYFPTLKHMKAFSSWLAHHMKNITLSSQRYYGSATVLQAKVKELEGLFIPAHVFTPFKSLYGKGVKTSLTEVLDPEKIDGIELGLSSDTSMADHIEELHQYTYISNSDAHSLAKIAREYQEMTMEEPSFNELNQVLHEQNGRRVNRNFGMNPKLGKYYTTVCSECFTSIKPQEDACSHCQSQKVTKGVFDRIQELANSEGKLSNRPSYLHQVPLEYLPTLGPKTFEKLLAAFQTEMNVIHHVSLHELKEVISEKLAQMIVDMREGKLKIDAGGGGKYGKVL